MENSWNYTQTGQYRAKIAEGMPPLIITCAVSGDHQKSENPNIPVIAEEQAEEAARVYAAGASIVLFTGVRRTTRRLPPATPNVTTKSTR